MTNEQQASQVARLHLSRRQFMKLTGLAGSGLVVAWAVGRAVDLLAAQLQGQGWSGRRSTPQEVDAWLSLGVDGTITLATGKIEFGQGIQTGFAQLAAEELDVPFEQIMVVMGQTDRAPYDFGTFGSLSTRRTGPLVQQAAAEMRQW